MLVVVLILAVSGMVLAANGTGLARWVLGGGASGSTGNNVTMNATLGQPVVGVVSGGNVSVSQAFWHGVYNATIYLPLVQR